VNQIKLTINQFRLWPLAVIITLFVTLGVYYSITVPLWEAPDEPGHFGNVWYIATHQALPQPGTFYTWHQAPLYHIIAATAIGWLNLSPLNEWQRFNPTAPTVVRSTDPNVFVHSVRELPPYKDIALAVHIARWLNVIFGAITVALTYLLARRLFPEHGWVAIGAAGLVAFNPQFIFMSAAVQNDAALSAAFALTLWPALNIVQGDNRIRQFLGLGALTALAILFKQSGIVLIGLAGVVVLGTAWRSGQWQKLFIWGSWTALMVGLIAGPMYLRNTLLYGDPFAYEVYKSLHPPTDSYPLNQLDMTTLMLFLTRLHESFWGKFGWLTLAFPSFIYQGLWMIYPLSGLGLIIGYRRGQSSWGKVEGGLPALALLLVSMAVVWTFTLRYAMSFGAFGVQGRYLFPMISAQSILISLGFYALLPGRWRPLPIIILLLILLSLAIWTPAHVIAPAYQYLGDSPQVLDKLSLKRTDIFGEAIELAGYEWQVVPPNKLQIALYWRTRQTPLNDYTIFIHLLDESGHRYSQNDQRPLNGNFPTQLWRPGDVLHTTARLTFPPSCLAKPCSVAVGFYLLQNGERLPVTQGENQDNAVILKLENQ